MPRTICQDRLQSSLKVCRPRLCLADGALQRRDQRTHPPRQLREAIGGKRAAFQQLRQVRVGGQALQRIGCSLKVGGQSWQIRTLHRLVRGRQQFLGGRQGLVQVAAVDLGPQIVDSSVTEAISAPKSIWSSFANTSWPAFCTWVKALGIDGTNAARGCHGRVGTGCEVGFTKSRSI